MGRLKIATGILVATAFVACGSPASVAVPDLTGTALPDARAALAEAGFEIEEVDATGANRGVWEPANWRVESQRPDGGQLIEPGGVVQLELTNVRDEESRPVEGQADSSEQVQDEARDRLDEYHASFGCGAMGWLECFGADEDPVGSALAETVMSVQSIEEWGSGTFEVRIQSNDPQTAVSVCTYVRNLWTENAEKPSVHVIGADGRELARTRLMDGNDCRA